MQSTVKNNLQTVNTMADNKKSFILHLDSLEVLDELTPTQCGELLLAMRAYNEGNDVKLSGLLKAVFIPFRNQFDRDLEKYNAIVLRNRENGAKGGKPKGTQTNPLGILGTQANPNKPDNDSDSGSDSGNENGSDFNASLVFENFRKLYPGTKRGHQTELDVLKKHKDWKVVLGALEGIITAEIQWRQNTKSQSPSTFIPEWPHLSTYLKQRRWETVREQAQAYVPPEQRQVTPDLPNHKRGVEYRRSGIENRTFKGNYNEYLDAKGCTPDETFTIVREYVIG